MIAEPECRAYLRGATVMYRQGFSEVALQWLGLAIESCEQVVGQLQREAFLLHCLGMIQYVLGDLPSAKELIEQAESLSVSQSVVSSCDLAAIYDNLGDVLNSCANFSAAADAYLKGLQASFQSGSEVSDMDVERLIRLSNVASAQGKEAEARWYLQKAQNLSQSMTKNNEVKRALLAA